MIYYLNIVAIESAQVMDQHEIQMVLKMKGSSYSRLAAAIGVTPAAVQKVSTQQSRSKRIEEEMSKACGIPLGILFPDWYSKTGTRFNFEHQRVLRARSRAPEIKARIAQIVERMAS